MTKAIQACVKPRPKHLGLVEILFQIRLPLPGKLSILHRLSGVGLFLLLGPLIALFQLSVTSPEAFRQFQDISTQPFVRLILAGLIWAYMHHFCAGIRFLLMDMHIGVDLLSARRSAVVVFAVSVLLTVILWWRVLL
ncbi:MAG: succinate dehydrogenase, cytochrome b556 subunit [Zoogloeaceae bacterium]|jgi:succinate dehydrogenase / fumarate reductase cytochrome b subunit|nr:succinate dehydrogenase, cytochrome b556 subunit [Zoogloeaceae bacterium]